jgi:hypothetical protein
MFVTNVGKAASLGFYLRWGGGAVVNRDILTPQLLSTGGTAGGPTSMRAMKAGASLVCTTPVLSRGGRVYTLNCEQRLLFPAAPSAFTAANCDTVYNSIIQHPHTHVHDATDFGEPKHLTCVVCDGPAYENFEENDGALAVDDFCAHIAQWGGGSPSDNERRPMSVLIYAFDIPANAQTFTFELTGRWYTRWPLSTVAGRLMTPIPVGTAAQVNGALAAARNSMHFPAPVKIGASTALFG